MVTATRPKMTVDQARQFSRYSPSNAATVQTALECGCKPYQDVFTYNRWRAQDMQVTRGQKAVKIPVIIETENEDGEKQRLFRTSAVFCRHQVKSAGESPAAAPATRPMVNPHASAIKQDKQKMAQSRFDKAQPAPASSTENIMKDWSVI